ncbi:MAG: hypothetical protein KDD52_07215, partial [Bdellovibrionales bacterium]|nr:hypothetical protein [Bdellovibrionales bacterium]
AQGLQENMDASSIHELIYQVKDELDLQPSDVFFAIYTSILGKSRGPRAGFFLASLDCEFVKDRLAHASKA